MIRRSVARGLFLVLLCGVALIAGSAQGFRSKLSRDPYTAWNDPDCATLGILTEEEARVFMHAYTEFLKSRGQKVAIIDACKAVHVRRWLRVQESRR